MTQPLLRVTDLTKHFPGAARFLRAPAPPIRAVDGVDLTIADGEMLALVGESGSGKSTLGRLVLRLLDPTSGQMEFAGREIAVPDAAFRKQAQVVFQDPRASLNPRRTIFQALRDPMLLHGMAQPATVRASVAALLERVGLAPAESFLDRLPRQLSGGQLQRVCIARAISLGPKLIVADEPVSALDASVRAQILGLVRRLQQEERLAFLFITHDLAVVRSIADRVAVMYLGKIVEEGPVASVFATPLHPYTEALLSATPVPDPRLARRKHRILLPGEVPSPAAPPPGCRFHTRCPAAFARCRVEVPRVMPRAGGGTVACHLRDGR